MRSKKLYLLFFMFICFWQMLSFAQDSSSSAPSQELVLARDGIDYSDDVIVKKEQKKSQPSSSPNFNFSDLVGVLLIILLLGIVMAILYFVLGKDNLISPRSRKIKELDLKAVEHIEENLENHDVAQYLKQAVQKRQFRIAIRLHYLLIIKKLSENKFIKWKKDKTNRDYIIETSSFSFSDKFRSSTRIFEKVWYGERSVEESDFNLIYEQFEDLNKRIVR